ncbi:hypothetical protein N473_20685 [Pseudoalteromonas luteoviolacea CPMOR-1]|uniref:PKD domain-containing protein n=1 Tax=Pseudoalteromonas luteoviolacea CPMOR-1 TaxID=1365248 RepID=A0A167K125_9GAMM|nr:hypothetical protein N473_20685 [Pseudoalteromonas luteoviolacea CPMOR-1]
MIKSCFNFNLKIIQVAILALTLTACGGGGGDKNTTPKSDSQVTSTQVNTDTTAPAITLNGDKHVEILLGNSYTELGAFAKDNVDGDLSVSLSGLINVNQVGTYTLTYTATDKAGNSSSVQRVITVIESPDSEAPIVTLNGDREITLSYGEAYQELGATATDNLDESVHVAISGFVDSFKPDVYKIAYTATDKAGNTGTASREVTVLPQKDITAPVISLNGNSYIKLFLNESYEELGASAIDDFDGEIETSTSGTVDTQAVGTYTVTYTAIDKAGNSTSVERTVDVIIQRAFITTWKTDNTEFKSTDEYTVKIATIGDGYNFNVDWGDGKEDTNVTSSISHRYEAAGTYTIKITGDFPRFYFDENEADRNKILSVEQWGDIRWSSMERAFFNCANLVVNALDAPDLSNVTNLSYMFGFAASLNQDINHWDVSNVTDMTGMFQGAFIFNQPIGTWDVSNVERMGTMFNEAYKFNQPIGDWDVSNLQVMSNMFNRATDFDQPLGSWNVASVVYMNDVFHYAESFNQDIGDWNTSAAFYMGRMFKGASSFNQDIGRWNVSGVAYMNSMFKNADSFDQNLRNWDVSNLVNMSSMFEDITLSVENYDAILQGWSELPNPPQGIGFHAGHSQYSERGKVARDILTDVHNWNIADGGLVE